MCDLKDVELGYVRRCTLQNVLFICYRNCVRPSLRTTGVLSGQVSGGPLSEANVLLSLNAIYLRVFTIYAVNTKALIIDNINALHTTAELFNVA